MRIEPADLHDLSLAAGRDFLDKMRIGPKTRAQAESLDPTDDLRELRLPYVPPGILTNVLISQLTRGESLAIAFQGRSDLLGALATLQVYGSDLAGESGETWFGNQLKTHAHGCHHHQNTLKYDDLMTFADWLPVWEELREQTPWFGGGSRLCTLCGGFSVRRLDEGQLAWVAAVVET